MSYVRQRRKAWSGSEPVRPDRSAGRSGPGFVFSDGIKEALKGKTWDAALLDAWLTDTIAVAPKAQMIYFQDDPEVRAMLIMFLSSLHD